MSLSEMVESSEHFSSEELMCKCGCGVSRMDGVFMERLEAVRRQFGKPMKITSAYRCPLHPIEKSKSHNGNKPTGMHPNSRAVDVAVERGDALKLIQIALEQGMRGIGVQQKSTGRFIHMDDRDGEPTIWSY